MCFGREGEAPFLALSEENKLMAFPLMVLHKEGPPTENSFPWTDLVQISSETECPLQKWVHIGCKVCTYRLKFLFTLQQNCILIPYIKMSTNLEDSMNQIKLG